MIIQKKIKKIKTILLLALRAFNASITWKKSCNSGTTMLRELDGTELLKTVKLKTLPIEFLRNQKLLAVIRLFMRPTKFYGRVFNLTALLDADVAFSHHITIFFLNWYHIHLTIFTFILHHYALNLLSYFSPFWYNFCNEWSD